MKKSTLLFCLGVFGLFSAQAPSNYYSGTAGLTKAALKTKLYEIISNGHNDKGYSGLWTGYKTTDIDDVYEKDGSLMDMYSENPNGSDPYVYKLGTNQCGSYSGEGSCYNREHSVPQSAFGEAAPMRNDIHHVVPTDGYVNNRRSTYVFGEVKNATWISKNGSKVGSSNVANYNGTVFEPIDEFKGDFARIFLYFTTRYQNRIGSINFGMFGSSAYPGLSSWSIPLLLKWHNQDPVSQREINRNNAAYKFQGNRNPFIDHPEFVDLIWGSGTIIPDNESPSTPTNLIADDVTATSVLLNWNASTDNIAVSYYQIFMDGASKTTTNSNSVRVTALTPNTTYTFHVVAKDQAGNNSEASNTVTITTLDGTPENPGEGDDDDDDNTTTCGIENFDNTPVPSNPPASSYDTRTWSNNGITWTATNARTDKQIYIDGDGNKAICIKKGSLKSTKINGGISSFSVKTYLPFSDSAGNYTLKINGQVIKDIPYSKTAKTTTITDINIAGEIEIELVDNTTNNRVSFDNLSWTCYTPLATADVSTQANAITVYPNPVKNNEITISGIKGTQTVQIYSVTGQVVETIYNVKNKEKLTIKKLPKGVYIVKVQDQSTKIIVD